MPAPSAPRGRRRKRDAAPTGRAPHVIAMQVLPAITAASAATTATTAPATALAVVTAAAALVAAAATAVAAAITAATAAVTAAATAVAAAATSTATTEATTAAAALLPLLGFVHPQGATVERATIHPLDRLGGFLGGAHGHEGKAAGAARSEERRVGKEYRSRWQWCTERH